MDPVRELPYWPAAMALLIEAGQMTASDYVPTYPNLSLAFEGASTDAIRSARFFHRRRLLLWPNFIGASAGKLWGANPYPSLER